MLVLYTIHFYGCWLVHLSTAAVLIASLTPKTHTSVVAVVVLVVVVVAPTTVKARHP